LLSFVTPSLENELQKFESSFLARKYEQKKKDISDNRIKNSKRKTLKRYSEEKLLKIDFSKKISSSENLREN
jgi:hypothetical protein